MGDLRAISIVRVKRVGIVGGDNTKTAFVGGGERVYVDNVSDSEVIRRMEIDTGESVFQNNRFTNQM